MRLIMYLAAEPGFEPGLEDPKSPVLPLHNSAFFARRIIACRRIWGNVEPVAKLLVDASVRSDRIGVCGKLFRERLGLTYPSLAGRKCSQLITKESANSKK